MVGTLLVGLILLWFRPTPFKWCSVVMDSWTIIENNKQLLVELLCQVIGNTIFR